MFHRVDGSNSYWLSVEQGPSVCKERLAREKPWCSAFLLVEMKQANSEGRSCIVGSSCSGADEPGTANTGRTALRAVRMKALARCHVWCPELERLKTEYRPVWATNLSSTHLPRFTSSVMANVSFGMPTCAKPVARRIQFIAVDAHSKRPQVCTAGWTIETGPDDTYYPSQPNSSSNVCLSTVLCTNHLVLLLSISMRSPHRTNRVRLNLKWSQHLII